MRKFRTISKTQAVADSVDTSDIKMPRRATRGSAGYDIFAPYDFTLEPQQIAKIPTGLKVEMNGGETLLIAPRSGQGFKYFARLANTIGVIDEDYYNNENNEGHIWVKIRNEGDTSMCVHKGEGMCQAIFVPYLVTDDDELSEFEVRSGGFGSTTKE